MKTYLKVMSYTLGILMAVGSLMNLSDGSFDIYQFIAFVIIVSYTIVCLMYINEQESK